MRILLIIPVALLLLMPFQSWADLDGKGLKCEGINFIFASGKLLTYEFGVNEVKPLHEYPFEIDLDKVYFEFAFVETYIDRKTLIWHLPSLEMKRRCVLVTHQQIGEEFEAAKAKAKAENKL